MNRVRLWLGIACGLLVVFVLARAGEAPSFKMTADETKLLELTNQERKKKELPPLRPSPLLFKLARAHSANMAKQEKMDHTLDGKTPFDRMKDAGYPFLRGGENIAAGSGDFGLPEVIREWMESKGHRENILGPDYTEIGVALARNTGGVVYYTQVFGKPREK